MQNNQLNTNIQVVWVWRQTGLWEAYSQCFQGKLNELASTVHSLDILGAHSESVLKALCCFFVKNQFLYEESESDFYFRNLIVALYCIVFVFFLLPVFILCVLASTQKTHEHRHNNALIHIFPNTVQHKPAEDDPFNTNKFLRMTNQVLEWWVMNFNESNHIKSCLEAECAWSLYMANCIL